MSALNSISNPMIADIGGAMESGRQKRKTRLSDEMIGEILNNTVGGKLGSLAKIDPEKAMGLAQALEIPVGQTSRLQSMVGDIRISAGLLKQGIPPQDVAKLLGEKSAMLSQLDIKPSKYMEYVQRLSQGDQTAVEEIMAMNDAFVQAGIVKGDKAPELKQGTGSMSGYSFNPSTGEYSIDPKLKAQMDADKAKAQKQAGQLTPKDIAGVNDKVTALTKDVRGIVASAKSLDGLKTRGSAASKLAAVFKFMKTLDPTSVVRESEQGQVYAAQGAAAALAGKLNQLIGEGALTEQGFQDVVDTAKTLANSAVEASQGEVASYLDVLADKITVSDYNKLKARVPELIDISSSGAGTPTVVRTQAEFDKLPSGAVYTGKDGKQYRKP